MEKEFDKNITGYQELCQAPNCYEKAEHQIFILYDFRCYMLCKYHEVDYHNFKIGAEAKYQLGLKNSIDKVMKGKKSDIL